MSQVAIAGESGPRPLGSPGERSRRGAGSSGQEDLTLSHGRDRRCGRGVRAPPRPLRERQGGKKAPPRDGTHAQPARPWEGKPNQSASPGWDHPRTSCRPRAAGRPGRGGAGVREGTVAPSDQGRGVTPPCCQVPWPIPVRAEGLKTRAAPPSPPGGTGGSGAARAPSRSGNTPRPRGGRLPGRAPGKVLGIVEADSQEGKPDGVPDRHTARSVDGRHHLPPTSPAPAGGRTLRNVACDFWRWITRLARR
ncbi:hypothetical protein NDU88_002280 [Pleurodeles waltl]|uniref:Uncharacterized protein n=1 Tax=Pleurodeles waltl TaxID=8319 RepID=A0AAV7LF62_PLEWA|nr:hypothetical protein NDU88_002280 [Pleurodeles waltl]